MEVIIFLAISVVAVKRIVDKDKQDKIDKVVALEEAVRYNPYRNIVYPDVK